MIVRPVVFSLLGLFAVGCSSSEPAVAPPTADAGTETPTPLPEPVVPGLFPLAGTDPTLVANDLARLDPIVGDAAIIGIGESVHTTGTQHHLRLRILRHLIEKRGLRAIAFESPWKGIADVMEPYVTTCAGSPQEAAKRLHTIWWDVSLPPFLQWLCEWNRAHPNEVVHVFGFDIRQPWYDAPAHRAYVGAGKAALADGMKACLGVGYADEAAFFADPLVRDYFDGKKVVPDEVHAACQAGVGAALDDLTANRATYVAASSDEAWDLVRLGVTQIGAFDTTIHGLSRVRLLTDLQKPNQARDVAMTDAFRTLRKHRFPALKTALWAHNGHVMKRAKTLVDSQWTGVETLGTALGEEHGKAYVVIGQTSWETTTNFQGTKEKLPKPTPRSLEAALEKYGEDALLLALPADATTLAGGELEVGTDPYTMVPASHFDAFTWLRVSGPMEPFAIPPSP